MWITICRQTVSLLLNGLDVGGSKIITLVKLCGLKITRPSLSQATEFQSSLSTMSILNLPSNIKESILSFNNRIFGYATMFLNIG